jgi:hypothetical protein
MGRLAWDTFPRTGTAWLGRCLESAFPHYTLEWGGHRATTLRKGNNVISTLRHPLPAISSYAEHFGFWDFDGLLEWYSRFTQTQIEQRDRIFVTLFDDIVSRPDWVLERYATRFSLTDRQPVRHDLQKHMQTNYKKHFPQERTKERLNAETQLLRCSALVSATSVYSKAVSTFASDLNTDQVSYPTDKEMYSWDEASGEWVASD